MTKKRHTQHSFIAAGRAAAISSACLSLFSCAAATTANSNTANIAPDSQHLLTKNETQEMVLPLTKLENGFSLALPYKSVTSKDIHANTPQLAYNDTHAKNSKDTQAITKKNTNEDTHVINIAVNEYQGVSLTNSAGKEQVIAGNYSVVNAEVVLHKTKQWVSLVMFNNDTQHVEVFRIAPESLKIQQQINQLTTGSEAICAATSSNGELQVINIDATGTLNQYEVYNGSFLSLRNFAIGPGIKSCALNTDTETLYLADEHAGVWQLDTNIESELAKKLIFHDRDVSIEGVATLPSISNQDSMGVSAWVSPDVSGVWLQTPCLMQFVSLTYDGGEDTSAFEVNNADSKTTFIQPEFVHLSLNGKEQNISLIVDDDHSGDFFSTELPSNVLLNSQCDSGLVEVNTKDTHTTTTNTNDGRVEARTSKSENGILNVTPVIETDPVENYGDAADDPAIWVNSLSPQQSRVIGTDKKGALNSYDLSGKLLQSLPVGRVNNVDVGYNVFVEQIQGPKSDASTIDIAVASNRSNNTLSVFEIDKRGDMTLLGDISTTLSDIYGLCMFVSDGVAQVFANDTSGRFERYHVSIDTAKTINGHLTQSFSLPSQPEGCVVNTKTNTAYLGEEGAGIWALNVSKNNEVPRFIAEIAAPVEADVEGLALFEVDGKTYLIASSQGNDSYAIYQIQNENPDALNLTGLIKITADKARRIDGASETDGLDVTNANLGGGFTEGLWVVQDGRNVMPSQTQNFKLVTGTSLKHSIRKLVKGKR
ncbi:phytase [Alteromonas sp. ALT199]|uniref:phytase n=1 Tax=unclassified Alteromonas TaxID=2614992 RepID=UPI001BED3153|nr:phytase [Alteromonas sp. ALT199]MBT3137151.1 phytase [Alteromonas sp. ALT199]